MSEAKANDVKAIIAGKARGCPFHTQKAEAAAVNWWPDQINLKPLGKSPPPAAPGAAQSYAAEFLSLDLDALKADVMAVMTKSQAWWPAGEFSSSFFSLLLLLLLRPPSLFMHGIVCHKRRDRPTHKLTTTEKQPTCSSIHPHAQTTATTGPSSSA